MKLLLIGFLLGSLVTFAVMSLLDVLDDSLKVFAGAALGYLLCAVLNWDSPQQPRPPSEPAPIVEPVRPTPTRRRPPPEAA